MVRVRQLPPLVRPIDTRTVRPPARKIDPIYSTPEFQAWRAKVVERAGYRCEAIDNGHRCSRAVPEHRMYADHIIELRDGGQPYDVNNGQCLCASHHERKTLQARARRHKSSPLTGGPMQT
jgi:5-methylcytosine-specific restriction enzyme A